VLAVFYNFTVIMRTLLLLCCLCPSVVLAWDWDLFPYGQKTWYREVLKYGKERMSLFVMDSIAIRDSREIQYFNRNPLGRGAGSCYAGIIDNSSPLFKNHFLPDSLVRHGDSILYYHGCSAGPFYFFPLAKPGKSWTVTSTYWWNSFQQISITCESEGVESFLGITDSVKVFSLMPEDSFPPQIPASRFRIKLSKYHGLVDFVPFFLFLYHPQYLDFTCLYLAGLEAPGVQYGFRPPGFHDYFPLNPGDILMWKFMEHSDLTGLTATDYFRDSIVHVVRSADSVCYFYDRIWLPASGQPVLLTGQQMLYLRRACGHVFGTTPNWYGFGHTIPSGSLDPGHVYIWHSGDLCREIDTVSQDSIHSYFLYSETEYIDTLSCQIHDDDFFTVSISVNTFSGVSLVVHTVKILGWDSTFLMGCRVSGRQQGSITLSVPVIPATEKEIVLYPVPASNTVFIQGTDHVAHTAYRIWSQTGMLVMHGVLSGNELNISDLSSGFYILSIERGSIRKLFKLIKKT